MGLPTDGAEPALREQLKALIDRQAEDDGLWFQPIYASEAYLQENLRVLHAAVEAVLASSQSQSKETS